MFAEKLMSPKESFSRTGRFVVRKTLEVTGKVLRPFEPIVHVLASTALDGMNNPIPDDIDYSQMRFRKGNGATPEPQTIKLDISKEEIQLELDSGRD